MKSKIKIAAIGDLHGKDTWKELADVSQLLDKNGTPDYDYYVFIGDYTDSFDKSNAEIMHNLKELVNFKQQYPTNVILLWGNHDVQYALQPSTALTNKHYCSGYRPVAHFDLYYFFKDNFELFQFAFQYENYLFTHAGVHKGWYIHKFLKEYEEEEADTLAETLNIAFSNRLSCLFNVGHLRGGHHDVGGPLWLDKRQANKLVVGYHQVVGHTASHSIQTITKSEHTSITFIDVLEHNKSFYTINLNKT